MSFEFFLSDIEGYCSGYHPRIPRRSVTNGNAQKLTFFQNIDKLIFIGPGQFELSYGVAAMISSQHVSRSGICK
jgi:hypothetical protein